MSELIGKALEIAWKAHEGQKDKGGHPYIRHPLSVAGQLDTEEEIMTALLHDVVEDTDYTLNDLKREGFPPAVIEALQLLTHDPEVEYMDYVRRIRPNALARRVKLADLWHNSLPERLAQPLTEKDRQRLEKYRKARAILNGEAD
ncbi:MAG: HD domain-containing protein [Firmicutes bacterium]|nr:HD domain-containing protein [Bacillota bacterium]